jgi:hypothetical protein
MKNKIVFFSTPKITSNYEARIKFVILRNNFALKTLFFNKTLKTRIYTGLCKNLFLMDVARGKYELEKLL